MAVVLCENHEPPLCFSVEDSLRRDGRDDACPECGQDDALVHVLTRLAPRDYACEHNYSWWRKKTK